MVRVVRARQMLLLLAILCNRCMSIRRMHAPACSVVPGGGHVRGGVLPWHGQVGAVRCGPGGGAVRRVGRLDRLVCVRPAAVARVTGVEDNLEASRRTWPPREPPYR